MVWNDPQQIELLKKLWAEGVPTRMIGAQMSPPRSKNSIISARRRMGLPERRNGSKPGTPKVSRIANVLVKPKKRPPNWRINVQNRVAPTTVATEAPTEGIPLMELRDHHCRAIVGTQGDYRGLATYCGFDIVHGSYCARHSMKYFSK